MRTLRAQVKRVCYVYIRRFGPNSYIKIRLVRTFCKRDFPDSRHVYKVRVYVYDRTKSTTIITKRTKVVPGERAPLIYEYARMSRTVGIEPYLELLVMSAAVPTFSRSNPKRAAIPCAADPSRVTKTRRRYGGFSGRPPTTIPFFSDETSARKNSS